MVCKERKADTQQYGMAIKASELLNPNKDVKKRDDKKAAKRPGYMQNQKKDSGEPDERGRDGN